MINLTQLLNQDPIQFLQLPWRISIGDLGDLDIPQNKFIIFSSFQFFIYISGRFLLFYI